MFYLKSLTSGVTGAASGALNMVSGAAGAVKGAVFGSKDDKKVNPTEDGKKTAPVEAAAAAGLPKPPAKPPQPLTSHTATAVSGAATPAAGAAGAAGIAVLKPATPVAPPTPPAGSPAPGTLVLGSRTPPFTPLNATPLAAAAPKVPDGGTDYKRQPPALVSVTAGSVVPTTGLRAARNAMLATPGVAGSATAAGARPPTAGPVRPPLRPAPFESVNKYLVECLGTDDRVLHAAKAKGDDIDQALTAFIKAKPQAYQQGCFLNLLRRMAQEEGEPNAAATLAFSQFVVAIPETAQVVGDAKAASAASEAAPKGILVDTKSIEIFFYFLIASGLDGVDANQANPKFFQFLLDAIKDPSIKEAKKEALQKLLDRFTEKYDQMIPRQKECFAALFKLLVFTTILTAKFFKKMLVNVTLEQLKDKTSLIHFYLKHCPLEILEQILRAYLFLEEDATFKQRMANSYDPFMNELVEAIKQAMLANPQLATVIREQREADPSGFATLSHDKFWKEYMPDLRRRYAEEKAKEAKPAEKASTPTPVTPQPAGDVASPAS